MKKYQYGLKLWSDNEKYISQAEKLYAKKIYDYIELYIVPGTYDRYIKILCTDLIWLKKINTKKI